MTTYYVSSVLPSAYPLRQLCQDTGPSSPAPTAEHPRWNEPLTDRRDRIVQSAQVAAEAADSTAVHLDVAAVANSM